MKINVKAFALATGITWGVNWFALTWWLILQEGITREVTLIGRIYRGFTISPVGSLIALGYGFVDGFLLGLLASYLYNILRPRLTNQ